MHFNPSTLMSISALSKSATSLFQQSFNLIPKHTKRPFLSHEMLLGASSLIDTLGRRRLALPRGSDCIMTDNEETAKGIVGIGFKLIFANCCFTLANTATVVSRSFADLSQVGKYSNFVRYGFDGQTKKWLCDLRRGSFAVGHA